MTVHVMYDGPSSDRAALDPDRRRRIDPELLAACGYFLPRLMFLPARHAPRINWGDIVLALSGFAVEEVDLGSAVFWREWLRRWTAVGDRHAETAAEARSVPARRDAWRAAAACYHWAEFMHFDDPKEKFAVRARVRECFEASLADGGLTRVSGEVRLGPNGSLTVPYWLYLPPGHSPAHGPPPCVVMSNGLDSMTEVEILSFAEMYLERGVAALLFDGPGQGIQVGRTPLWTRIEDVVTQLLDEPEISSRIAPDRLAFFGVSFGGHLALRAAQTVGDRFRCVVNASGGPRVAPFATLPRRLKDDFRFVLMTEADAVQSRLDEIALDPTTQPGTSVLSVHGTLDDIFPARDMVELDRLWGDRHTLTLYRGEDHVCLNRLAEWAPRAADWVHARLRDR